MDENSPGDFCDLSEFSITRGQMINYKCIKVFEEEKEVYLFSKDLEMLLNFVA